MERDIYRLLNDVKTDVTEYDELHLSSEEKESYKCKILQEVRNMKKTIQEGNQGNGIS